MDIHELDTTITTMLVETFNETASETVERSGSRLTAMREGVVAASMLLAALTGIEDQAARDAIRKWAHNNPDLEF